MRLMEKCKSWKHLNVIDWKKIEIWNSQNSQPLDPHTQKNKSDPKEKVI